MYTNNEVEVHRDIFCHKNLRELCKTDIDNQKLCLFWRCEKLPRENKCLYINAQDAEYCTTVERRSV